MIFWQTSSSSFDSANAAILDQRRHLSSATMPIRMRLITASSALASTQSPIASFLLPCLVQPLQQRHASILASLSDNRAAYNKKIRRGRGPASGKGKTSGRGHKGQKQHGKVPAGFNGGQTPDIVVSGVRGFENQYETVTRWRSDSTQTRC